MVGPAASSEDRLKTLRKLRDRIGETIDQATGGRELAILSAELRQVMVQIEGLQFTEQDSPADTIAARREARRRQGLPVSKPHDRNRGRRPTAEGA
jgi:hypothetical protein